jgi:hypothetical protein
MLNDCLHLMQAQFSLVQHSINVKLVYVQLAELKSELLAKDESPSYDYMLGSGIITREAVGPFQNVAMGLTHSLLWMKIFVS